MSKIQVLPAPEEGRVETGAVQFGSDWPGMFIRGDNAAALAMALDHPSIVKAIEERPIDLMPLKSLRDTIFGKVMI